MSQKSSHGNALGKCALFYLQTTFAKPKTQCDLGETIFGCYSEGYRCDAVLRMGGAIVIKAIPVAHCVTYISACEMVLLLLSGKSESAAAAFIANGASSVMRAFSFD